MSSTTTINAPKAAVAYPLVTIKQAISVCWIDTLDLVPVLWGPVGWTKSATIKSLTDDLALPLHDVRLSDKEPTDLGGIPFPVDIKMGDGSMKKCLTYLVTNLLPFADIYGDDYECVLFFDEVDRTSVDVLNVALQLLLDKGVNGRKLSAKTHICCAGNGITDSGTTELTSAAATRLVHFYVDTHGPKALDHWAEWAVEAGVDVSLIGFSKFRPALFGGKEFKYLELQSSNPRTLTWASKALDTLQSIPAYGPEVGDAIVFGLVGQGTGREYSAYRSEMQNCPTFEEVVRNPDSAPLPSKEKVGILYALGQAFLANLFDGEKIVQGLSPEVNRTHTKAVAKYFLRAVKENESCRECAAWFFRHASTKLPSLASLPEYKTICE